MASCRNERQPGRTVDANEKEAAESASICVVGFARIPGRGGSLTSPTSRGCLRGGPQVTPARPRMQEHSRFQKLQVPGILCRSCFLEPESHRPGIAELPGAQRFLLNLSCERKTICNMLFGNWLWQQTRSSYCTLSMLLGKYSVNPSPALAFSRSGGYSRPLWTTDQPLCSVSRPCESQSRNWHPSPLVRHRIPRHRNPFVPPRLSPSAPVRFARG